MGASATRPTAAAPAAWAGPGHAVSWVSEPASRGAASLCSLEGGRPGGPRRAGAREAGLVALPFRGGTLTRLRLSPACPAGRYGAACSLDCACHQRGPCDPATGACRCGPGFYGQACEHCESWRLLLAGAGARPEPRSQRAHAAAGGGRAGAGPGGSRGSSVPRAHSGALRQALSPGLPQPVPPGSTGPAARGCVSVSGGPPVTPSAASVSAPLASTASSARGVSAPHPACSHPTPRPGPAWVWDGRGR